MSCALRLATLADLEFLLSDLMPQYYTHDHLEFSREKLEPVLREVIQNRADGRLWLIESQGEVIGYGFLAFSFSLEHYGREAFVDELFILPDYRQRGFGRSALEQILGECRNLGIQTVRLEVTAHNPRAQKLYLSLGFEDRGRSLLVRNVG